VKPSKTSRARASFIGWPGASEVWRGKSSLGSRNAGDIPVDSHQLIALCAPRLTFISYGIPDKGDAKWLDQQGSFMATVAAGSVFRLLGAKDIGVTDDYRKAKMPPVNTSLLQGQLAWRQHDGGTRTVLIGNISFPGQPDLSSTPLRHPADCRRRSRSKN